VRYVPRLNLITPASLGSEMTDHKHQDACIGLLCLMNTYRVAVHRMSWDDRWRTTRLSSRLLPCIMGAARADIDPPMLQVVLADHASTSTFTFTFNEECFRVAPDSAWFCLPDWEHYFVQVGSRLMTSFATRPHTAPSE
jgi:hypothetical protein